MSKAYRIKQKEKQLLTKYYPHNMISYFFKKHTVSRLLKTHGRKIGLAKLSKIMVKIMKEVT